MSSDANLRCLAAVGRYTTISLRFGVYCEPTGAVHGRLMAWKNAIRDVSFRKSWAAQQSRCAACGLPKGGHWLPHSVHHICKPGRSDEACNLLYLCAVCHSLAEGLALNINGQRPPTLSLGACLTIKQLRQPQEFDIDRSRILYCRNLPDLEAVPAYFVSRARQQGWPYP